MQDSNGRKRNKHSFTIDNTSDFSQGSMDLIFFLLLFSGEVDFSLGPEYISEI